MIFTCFCHIPPDNEAVVSCARAMGTGVAAEMIRSRLGDPPRDTKLEENYNSKRNDLDSLKLKKHLWPTLD